MSGLNSLGVRPMSRLLTPADVEAVCFHYKTSLFSRRDWYDAGEVDEFIDDAAYTILTLWKVIEMGKEGSDGTGDH